MKPITDYVTDMIAWEAGELSNEETINLFQYLIDTEQAWTLQGCYGRQAEALIDAGLIKIKIRIKT
ncbi:hypothetical protein ACFLQL_03030 [Verrucomicrobiota bacterium]